MSQYQEFITERLNRPLCMHGLLGQTYNATKHFECSTTTIKETARFDFFTPKEEIDECTKCKKPECTNCLQYRRKK